MNRDLFVDFDHDCDVRRLKSSRCQLCKRGSGGCDIAHHATVWHYNEPNFPAEVTKGAHGFICAAFEHVDEPEKYRCPQTLELPL